MSQEFHLWVFEENANTNLKSIRTPMFLYSSEDVEATTVSISQSVGKGVCVCTA